MGAVPAFTIEPSQSPVPEAERLARIAAPGFGKVFTDHMVTIRYAEGKGWYDAKVTARQPLTLDPATAVLHYAQEIFEGLKAYRLEDGSMALFRPDANAQRFNASARRMAMAVPGVANSCALATSLSSICAIRSGAPSIDTGSGGTSHAIVRSGYACR